MSRQPDEQGRHEDDARRVDHPLDAVVVIREVIAFLELERSKRYHGQGPGPFVLRAVTHMHDQRPRFSGAAAGEASSTRGRLLPAWTARTGLVATWLEGARPQDSG